MHPSDPYPYARAAALAALVVIPTALIARVLWSRNMHLRRHLLASALLWCFARPTLDLMYYTEYMPRDPLVLRGVILSMLLFMLWFHACAARAAARAWNRRVAVGVVTAFVAILLLGGGALMAPSLPLPLAFAIVAIRRMHQRDATPTPDAQPGV